MATTVITCPGAFGTFDTDNFGGTLFESPNTRIAGSWNNWTLTNGAATTDRDTLYGLITTHQASSDWLVVAGHSRGAQVIYKLFRERMDDLDSNVDPETTLFISAGNPETRWTGACHTDYAGKPPVYPGTQPYGNGYGLLDSGDFTVLNIARTYDVWADTPADWGNEDATNAMDNAASHTLYENAPELTVDGWPVDWNEWTRYDVGNMIYLTEKPPLVITPPAKTPAASLHAGKAVLNWKSKTELLDNAARSAIESAYTNRPTPLVGLVETVI